MTDHTRAAEVLAVKIRQQEAVAALSTRALAGIDLQAFLDEAVRTVAETLEVEYGLLLELTADRSCLVPRASVGWRVDRLPDLRIEAGRHTQAGHTLHSGEPVIVEDIVGETRFFIHPVRRQHGIISAATVAVSRDGKAFGVLGAHSNRPRAFSQDDVFFLQSVANVIAMAMDRARAELALQQSEELFRLVFDRSPIGLSLTGLDGVHLRNNRARLDMLGYSDEELQTMPFSQLTHPDDIPLEAPLFADLIAGRRESYVMEKRYITKGGETVWVHITVSLIRNEAGNPAFTLAAIEDITLRKQAEEALEHQAMHDALTGLPNRVLLQDRLRQAILAARRDRSRLALLLMDIDRFKEINDTFGHQHGDLLLQEVANRVQGVLRESDTVARLGGDEFGALLPATDENGAISTAEKVIEALDQPFILGGQSFVLSASIGIVLYPQHAQDDAALLRKADIAMYVAKRQRNSWVIYSAEQDTSDVASMVLRADLRRAIAANQLVLHFQPKISLQNGAVEQVEALVRWNHPERGLIPPAQFIKLAEHTGLIKPLTSWVLDAALRQIKQWQAHSLAVNVAVNVSAQSLRDCSLADELTAMLRAREVDPGCLTLEVTESAVMEEQEYALTSLSRLRDLGVKVAIDDFGTGYSSLAYLKQLPVDELKIDRAFVQELASNSGDTHIVRTIVELGHRLGLDVVAEGIETREVLDLVTRLGCDMAQGYFFSRPLPADDLAACLGDLAHLKAS